VECQKNFIGSQPLHDDLTMMVLEVGPAEAAVDRHFLAR
jgi:hypothetical protein